MGWPVSPQRPSCLCFPSLENYTQVLGIELRSSLLCTRTFLAEPSTLSPWLCYFSAVFLQIFRICYIYLFRFLYHLCITHANPYSVAYLLSSHYARTLRALHTLPPSNRHALFLIGIF